MMAMVTVIAGRETTFKPLLDAALRRGLVRAGLDPALAEGAMSRLPDMPAYPDVPDALAALRDGRLLARRADAVRGRRGRGRARRTRACGASFDLVLSAPASGAFKPEDLAYRYALEQARRDRRVVRGRTLVGRRRCVLRGPADRLDLPHRPRLPGRDARPGRRRPRPRRGRRAQSSTQPKGVRPLHRTFMLEEGAGGEGDVVLEPVGERGAVAADGGVGDVDDRAGDAVDGARSPVSWKRRQGEAADAVLDRRVEVVDVLLGGVDEVAAAELDQQPRVVRVRRARRPRPSVAIATPASTGSWSCVGRAASARGSGASARSQAAARMSSRLLKRW